MVTATKTRWLFSQIDESAVSEIVRELGVHTITASALVQRGVTSAEAAFKYLNPRLEDLHDPFLLPDITEAVRILLNARDLGETIYLHGDYDTDGVTSAAIFDRFLRKIGCTIITHVPHRIKEGYGIHADAVEVAHGHKAKVFLTCDCGGSAFSQIERALELGMKVVVTDHHHVGEKLPQAHAFVNPHRPDSTYPFSDLCGAGVAFKVCQAITKELDWPMQKFFINFLDLVTVGTVGDIVPLVDENRILVRNGLPYLSQTNNKGLKALIQVAGLSDQAALGLESGNISFGISPRLNAAGRLDDAKLSLQLLLADTEEVAMKIALKIEELNTQRRDKQAEMVEQAIELAAAQNPPDSPLIITYKDDWHPGILGVVAGRLREHFYRPAFVLTYDESSDSYSGSGRSIPGFSLAEIIKANHDIVSGGGHAMAAGMSIPRQNLEAAIERLVSTARTQIDPNDLVPAVELCAEVDSTELSLKVAKEIEQLAPFGQHNQKPIFALRNLELTGFRPTKKPQHVFPIVRNDVGTEYSLRCWNRGEEFAEMRPGGQWDVAVELGVNRFRGNESLDCYLVDYVATSTTREE